MRIISWNIQDGKKPEALAKLIFLSNKFKPYIMFILETMTSHQNSLNFLKALHFDHKLIIDPQPLWRFLGGLEQCHYRCLKPLYYSQMLPSQCPLQALQSRIYNIWPLQTGSGTRQNEFWQYLSSFIQTSTLPWLAIGEYNEMLSFEDKLGGRALSTNQLARLPQLLSTPNGHDVTTAQSTFFMENLCA